MLTDVGNEVRGVGGVSDVGGGPFEGMLLDSLATVGLSASEDLGGALGSFARRGEGLVVAVLGALDADDVAVLTRLRRGSTACVAVLVDTASWTSMAPQMRSEAAERYDASSRLLRAAGWRVLPVTFGTTLGSVWGLAAPRTGGEGARDTRAATGVAPR
jgi:hypothetical protein